MPSDRRHRPLGTLALAALSLVTPGCGLAGALLIGAITDAIDGGNDDGGDPTVLNVFNDAVSTEAVVQIDVSRVDGAHVPYSYPVSMAAGGGTALKNVFDAGAHWVRVVYASGWRSRARSITIVKDGSVSTTFSHGAPLLTAMAGTWFGATESLAGVSHTYALTLDASGQASARSIDGVASAATGVLAETSEDVYRVTWSDTIVVALVSETTHGHAGLVSDDGTVGAIQKGAVAPLPTGADANAVGTWVGAEVRLAGFSLTPSDLDAANATVSAVQHWVGTDGDGDGSVGTSPLLCTVPAFLRFECDAQNDAGSPLSLGLWLTADRAFAFVRLTSAIGAFPDTDTFQLLAKTP